MSIDSEITSEQARGLWLAERNRPDYIGASECAAALGASPWQSRFQLWAQKCGFVPPDDLSENEAVEFGLRLERVIADSFAERTGRAVSMCNAYQIRRHPVYSWMGCTPDAVQNALDEEIELHPWMAGTGNLQIKTAGHFSLKEWTDEPPLHYQIQVQHEMAVIGAEWSTIVVLIAGQKLRWFDVQRNDEFIDAMLPRLDEFLECVRTETAPPADGDEATRRALGKMYPRDDGESVELPEEATTWDVELCMAKDEIKRQESIKLECENKIKQAIGNATMGLLPDGTGYSWKTSERKGYTVEATTLRTLRRTGKAKGK